MRPEQLAWDDIRLFLAVAETGSMSAAAERLGVAQATVSRRLSGLEVAVGVALFERRRHGSELTQHGQELLVPARQMAEWAAEAERTLMKQQAAPSGLVRITAGPLMCTTLLASFAGYLAVEAPQLQLELLAAVRFLELSQGEAELALRTEAPARPDLVTVARVEHAQHIYVAESLLRRLPKPLTLAEIPWVGWAPPFDALTPNPELRRMIPGFRPSFTTDDFLVMVAAAEAGVGAIVLADPVRAQLRGSPLVAVPMDLGGYNRGALYLVVTRSALAIPRVRAVANSLAEWLAQAVNGASAE